MALPGFAQARDYHRCAKQRYEEAELLARNAKTTGAVYLAGYGVECMLKALVLTAAPPVRRADVLRSFRGGKAHDFEWLRSLYIGYGGARFPRGIARSFSLVSDWSTDLRYSPRSLRASESDAFMRSAWVIVHWADGRL